MKTSYYQNPRLKNGGCYYIVQISRSQPKWGIKPHLKLLEAAPTEEMLKNGYEYSEYEAALNSQKKKIEEVLKSLPKNTVFCCFEKDASKCHRAWFALWLKENFGMIIEELN